MNEPEQLDFPESHGEDATASLGDSFDSIEDFPDWEWSAEETLAMMNEEYQWRHDRAEQDIADIRRIVCEAIYHPERVGEHDYLFSDAERWLYIFKAMLCIAFGWYALDKHGEFPDEVDLGTITSSRDGYGWSASWAVVGYGLFKNWFVSVREDSDSSF